MNIVVFVCDTLRYDYLGCNGNPWIKTPNFDKLAAKSCVFDRAYVGSFPTLPNRMDCFNGRYNFLYRGWGPLPAEPALAEIMTNAGYVTQLVCDTPHMINLGRNFERGFMGWHMTRGQESDPYHTAMNHILEGKVPDHVVERWGRVPMNYRNAVNRRTEMDWPAPQTMIAATEWLEMNYKADKFFLWIDCFDPHEPWDAPDWFADGYYPGYKGTRYTYPRAGRASRYSRSELKWFQAQYAAKVTFVDKWIGFALRKLEDLGLDKTTTVMLTSDHGTCVGDHNRMGKGSGRLENQLWPLTHEISQIPLLIRKPDQTRMHRIKNIVQPFDLMPTILDLAGATAPEGVQGRSFAHMLEGGRRAIRRYAISTQGIYDREHVDKRMHMITGKDWALSLSATGKHELYDLKTDPCQKKNVFRKNRDVARGMFKWLENLVAKEGVDPSLVGTLGP